MERLCFYLQRGLWEIAKGLIHPSELEPVDAEIKSALYNLLWCMSVNPCSNSFSSGLVETPWQQSWLATSLIYSLKKRSGHTNEVDIVRKEIEFQSILYSLSNEANSSKILEEIGHLFSGVVRADKQKHAVEPLSPETLGFLRDCLLHHPVRGNALIQHLLCLWSSQFVETDNQLQDLYKEVLWLCIQEHEFGFPPTVPQSQVPGNTQTLLCLVSLLEVSEKKQSFVEWLAAQLFHLSEAGLISHSLVYLSLISRGSLKFLEALTALEDDKYDRCRIEGDVETLRRIVGRLVDEQGNLRAEELFYRTMHTEQHWVETLLDMCTKLIEGGGKDAALQCLSHPLLSKLWPLVLLNAWDKFSVHGDPSNSLRFIINQCQLSGCEPVFCKMTAVLEREMEVVHWCQERSRGSPRSTKVLLHLAKQHSTLELLHRTVDLAQVDWGEVQSILSGNRLSNVDDQPNSELGWEEITFSGFCIIMTAFNTIQAAMEIKRLGRKMNKSRDFHWKLDDMLKFVEPSYFKHKYPSALLEHPSPEQERNIPEDMHAEMVTKNLQQMKRMICKLFPLTFRLEVMEDVFSLLFLRYENFLDENLSDSGADDDEREPVQSPEMELAPHGDLARSMPRSISVFHQTQDVSASLRNMAIIEAEVSTSPPIDRLSCRLVKSPVVDRLVTEHGGKVQPEGTLPRVLSNKFSPVSDASLTHLSSASSQSVKASPSEWDRRKRGSIAGRLSQGFVCDKDLIGDILTCLKECLLDTIAASYSALSQPSVSQTHIPSSVDEQQLQHRTKRLMQHVNEATWRLQLLLEDRTESSGDWVFPCEESSSDSDEETSKRGGKPRKTRKHSVRSSWSESSESGSQSATGGGSTVGVGWARRGRRRGSLLPLPTGPINFMLSSYSSLVVRCLVQGNLTRAAEVVQLCDNDDLRLEVEFAQAHSTLRQKMTSTVDMIRKAEVGQNESSIGKKPSTLQAIRQVATAGLQSTSLTQLVENFLFHTRLPSIPGADKVLTEFPQAANMLLEVKNSAAMAAIDLALTFGSTYRYSASLLDIACHHCHALQTYHRESGRSGTTPGYVQFAGNAVQLLHEAHREHRVPTLSQDISIPALLNSPLFPLQLPRFKDCLAFWTDLDSVLAELNAGLASSRERVHSRLKELHNDMANVAFWKLKKIVLSSALVKCQKKSASQAEGTEKEELCYLDRLFTYLKLLSSMWIQNLPVEKGLAKLSTYFNVLDESVVGVVGHLVFEGGVCPHHLEPAARKLGLNLMYNVVRNCCPNIPLALSSPATPPTLWGRIILNQAQLDQKGLATRHPEVAARCLLSDLLQTLRELTEGTAVVDRTQAAALSKHPAVRGLLTDTHELALVDVAQLSPGDETVVFCSNLANLMWLHSLLVCDIGLGSDGLRGLMARCCVGYNVGGLGFVSLHQLGRLLLGEDLTFPLAAPLRSLVRTGNLRNCLAVTPDPRLVFALMTGHTRAPRVQVLSTEGLDSQLDLCTEEYLNQRVRLQEGGTKLVIPRLVQVYQDFVLLNQEPESHCTVPDLLPSSSPNHFTSTVKGEGRLALLLDFLRDNTSGQLQTLLVECADSVSTGAHGVEVVIEEGPGRCGVTLEYLPGDEPSAQSHSGADGTWRSDVVVKEPVLKFLKRHCWLLSVLVHRIHCLPTTDATNERTRCLDRLISSVSHSDSMNPTVAALHPGPDLGQLWRRLEALVMSREWVQCSQLLWSIPEMLPSADPSLQALGDIVMLSLASALPSIENPSPWRFCQHIGDITLQADSVLRGLTHWPAHGCIEALNTLLEDRHQLPPELRTSALDMLHSIQIYHKVLTCCNIPAIETWVQLRSASETHPGLIIDHLIPFQLCLKWAELHNILSRQQHLIDSRFLLLLLDPEPSDFSAATKLLLSLPTRQAVSICDDLIHQLRSIPCIQFVVGLVLDSLSQLLSPEAVDRYRCLSVGVKMLSALPECERWQHWRLVGRPQLLVEQFLMNTRLEMLERMLGAVRASLEQLPLGSAMAPDSIDSMLRLYAAKALDFRVVKRPCCKAASEEKLLVSLSTTDTGHSEEFVMPSKVPTKKEWMPNDQVTECMCCKAVVFSMFNRRHHCRRCGRVVCGHCSTHRVQVDGYGDVPVRACDACLEKQQAEDHSAPRDDLHSDPQHEFWWKLTSDEVHNATVREEFGFEHAPSVSLCLAILKLHSEHTGQAGSEQPVFKSCRLLLESSNRMLSDLQPIQPGTPNPEVDYSLVIRMVKSLVVAAKVKYARWGPKQGVLTCDQLLSQVDLLGLLVSNGCSGLIPVGPRDSHALRRLRDKLVEEELWGLALDVSTKAGFDRAGVWAAWGKACLRAGRWPRARDKFSHCLDSASRPPRNPPLLDEIVRTLEQEGAPQSDLRAIARGQFPQGSPPSNTVIIGPRLDSSVYEECRHYLDTYGSHAGVITFLLRHDDLPAALSHVLARDIEPETFMETVYMPCLRQGLVAQLHQEMLTRDSSLVLFKTYLSYVCRHLERQGFLNVLYQLQLFIHDYVRAAMTRILFYKAGAKNYTQLGSNLDHLLQAQCHLQAELAAIHWTSTSGDKSGPKAHLAMKLDPRDVDRHINTICRQVEVTKLLAACEATGRPVLSLVPQLCPAGSCPALPTLFGNSVERSTLAVLAILCGKDVEEGFGIAFRIIQDYHLKPVDVYGPAGRKMALNGRVADIERLVSSVRSSGISHTSALCDEVLTMCVATLADQPESGQVEPIIRLITDVGNKISAYIKCRQLKAAYLLAVKLDRAGDVQRIMEEAERLGQNKIHQICLKRLGHHSNS